MSRRITPRQFIIGLASVHATDDTNSFPVLPPYPGDEYIACIGDSFELFPDVEGRISFNAAGEGSVLLYTGPDCQAIVTLAMSIVPDINQANRVFGVGVAINGDLIGGPTFGPTATALQTQSFEGAGVAGPSGNCCVRRTPLTDGDLIQPVLSKETTDSAQHEQIWGYNFSVLMIGDD